MDHAPQDRGQSQLTALRVPDPHFSRTVLAGERPAGAGTKPAPASADRPEPSPVEQLRWARCPDDDRLHLVQPVDATLATVRGHAQTVCGHRIPAAGLTITSVASGALCMACVITATS